MKKIINYFFIFLCSIDIYAFDVDQKIFISSFSPMVKIGSEIGIGIGNEYQIKDLSTYRIDASGWYNAVYCGDIIYPVFGSNFFVFFKSSNKEGMFVEVENFDEYIKKNYYWGHPLSIKSDDDYFWPITRYIRSIEVPDILEETVNGKRIVYDTYDMMHFYISEIETINTYYGYNAKPWATSKNPQGMKIRMNLTEPKDKIVILNGYVHPGKRHLYKANRRLKTVKVTSPEAKFEVIESIEDVVHFHEIGFPAAVSTVDIEILDYYEGEKYKDLCVQMFGVKNLINENNSKYLKDFSILTSWRKKYLEK